MDGVTESQKNSPALDVFAGGSEMAALMRNSFGVASLTHDWSNTPLGSVETWPQSLRTSVSTMLASRFAQTIFWGEDYIQLYNDAMIPTYGANHPKALGQPPTEIWPEIWHDRVKPLLEGVRITGEAFFAEDWPLPLLRFGYLEETYMTFCYSPIWDETGKISGILCTATETTQQVIGQRRLTMLRELATAGSGAKTRLSACLAAADALNPYDIPFALFYQVNGNLAELVASSGLPADSAAAPRAINLTERSGCWSLVDVLQSRKPLLITDVVDRFGSLPVEPWGESPQSAFILPILSGNKEQVECLLVVGISARLQFSAEYRSFLELVAQQVESSISTARSYEQERQRAEALAELDRAKTTFFSNVSHEFRTPLTLMLGPAEDALSDRENPLSPHQRQRIEVMQRNGLRLLNLVNTLLDFSRIESDRIFAVYEPTDLATFTAELASVFRSAIERANLRLVVDCPSLAEPIYVDREMWEKIVLNLLSNAFKFTFTGEITVRLHRVGDCAKRSGRADRVELAVQDTGVGIPAAEIPHLFERFHRVKGAQGRTFEGSGIGLALVQELVKLHGGTVQVSSVEGEGSCFRVSIPTGCAHLPPERIRATRTLTSTALGTAPYVEEALRWLPEEDTGAGEERSTPSDLDAPHPQRGPHAPPLKRGENSVKVPRDIKGVASSGFPLFKGDGRGIALRARYANEQGDLGGSPRLKTAPTPSSARILLVDDNADMRDYVKRLLSDRWQVETAANGAIALDLIHQQLPDLVLTDVMMPEVDGFQLLQALRADPQTKSIPIILLSARAGEEATVEGLKAGADDYLIKPFSARELMAQVETQLQMSRLRQERSVNRLKDEFLSTVTHELNAPLAAILTWARLLQTKPFDRPMMLRALEAIERNASNQAKLIEDLLDMFSILAGKRGLNPQPVDLIAIIDDVLDTLYPTAQAKAISLSYGINDIGLDSDSPALSRVNTNLKTQTSTFTVSGEPKRLRQIVNNLLSNAIKFTPEGGQVKVQLNTEAGVTHLPPKSTPGALLGETPKPQWLPNSGGLQSSSSPHPSHSPLKGERSKDEAFYSWGARGTEFAQITIKDTGIGISADFLPYVFDGFRQAEVPSRHSPGGVGIGLAIARHLVELHGGTIEVASEGEGRGATFTVRLPIMNPTELNSNAHT
jgi:signal transduction histidine kinase